MQRRKFIQTSSLCLGGGLVERATSAEQPKKEPRLTLGLVTDIHYADKPAKGSRQYRDSLAKAEEAADFFKEVQPARVVCLGDLIDSAPTLPEEIAHLKTISKVLDRSGVPRRHVLGNHCVHTLTKQEFFEHSGIDQKQGRFSEELNGVRLIILDACFNRAMESYQRKNFQWSDSNMPRPEQKWLEDELASSEVPAIVFVHQRLDLEPEDPHSVKQSPEIRQILETSGKVLAVFQGHSHKNDLKTVRDIPYCTLAALVTGSGLENNAYSLLEVFADGSVKLKGYHRQVDQQFQSRDSPSPSSP